MLEPAAPASNSAISQRFTGLVQFLIRPFLEAPDSLKVDCEVSPGRSRVWIRLAFEGSDKGRVFGRGGRNIQAIRTVLQAVAQLSGYSAYLDVYGSQAGGHEGDSDGKAAPPTRGTGPRSPKPRS